ncbi:hypothetical protein DYI37_03110 [Fulvimarina endophytica]|uniref:Uncharacterized protein n=1 Tax=Fulvimarina endophytica TaxID=2293836 RepID=A0A371XB35_9HYPH|nr:hypothetical protein [Fulvimarina endophytica]RFC66447.1 hypothetical protein DYI37_03110 [Fulvimarina endophytica]
MTYYAATRLTLTKSRAKVKPTVEKDEPFPTDAGYGPKDMERLKNEGLVYEAPKTATDERKAEERAKAQDEAEIVVTGSHNAE